MASNWIRRYLPGGVAIFIAVTTAPAWGAATIGSSDIKPNAVLSTHIKDGQVGSRDIGTGQVKGVDLAPGAVTSAKVADNSLRGTDIAEPTLGLVPNADALDGISSGGF